MKVLVSRFDKRLVDFNVNVTDEIVGLFVDLFERKPEIFKKQTLKEFGIKNKKEFDEYYNDVDICYEHGDYLVEVSKFSEYYTIHKKGTDEIHIIYSFDKELGVYTNEYPKKLKTEPLFVDGIDKLGYDENLRFKVVEIPDEIKDNFRYCEDDFNNQWIEPNNSRFSKDYRFKDGK